MADAEKIIADKIAEWQRGWSPYSPKFNSQECAKEVLSALAAAGLKVVGREPTIRMLEACLDCNEDCDTDDFWRAMFDAAPPTPDTSTELSADRLAEIRTDFDERRKQRHGDDEICLLFGHIDALTAKVAALERDAVDWENATNIDADTKRSYRQQLAAAETRADKAEAELAAARAPVGDAEIEIWVEDLLRPLKEESWLPAFQFLDGFDQINAVRKKSADLIARLSRERGEARAALIQIADRLNCSGQGVDTAHYCPNCDNSLYSVREIARAALKEKAHDADIKSVKGE